MRTPLRVVWSEGMLLSPQHLQAQDRWHEALLDSRLASLASDRWGVIDIEFDVAALAAGHLRLIRFAGVLPGGLFLAFDEGDPGAPPPRALAEAFPVSVRNLEVFLAVPRERSGVPTFSPASETQSRYLSFVQNIEDSAGEGGVLSAALARPNAQILVGAEPREDHEILKLGEVVRNAAGQFAMDERAFPPLLRTAAAPSLMRDVREVLARAIAKVRELGETRKHRDLASGELAPGDLTRLLQILTLNRHIPFLRYLAETGDLSARDAYLGLAALTGELGTFTASVDVTDLPKYVHANPRESFEPLIGRLGALLGGLAIAQYLEVELKQHAGGMFLARLTDERLLQGAQLFLLVTAELPEQRVVEQVPRLCKIAAPEEIQALLRAAAPGLVIQPVHRPPPQLPVRPGAVYFALTTGDRYWQGIVGKRGMAIYLPPPLDPARTKLEMLAVVSAS